jgi:hypothetical protein
MNSTFDSISYYSKVRILQLYFGSLIVRNRLNFRRSLIICLTKIANCPFFSFFRLCLLDHRKIRGRWTIPGFCPVRYQSRHPHHGGHSCHHSRASRRGSRSREQSRRRPSTTSASTSGLESGRRARNDSGNRRDIALKSDEENSIFCDKMISLKLFALSNPE